MLAAFLKAIGFIIPLMDAMYANYYTREVMVILVREFQTPDEEMKKIVLKVRRLAHLWECSASGRPACARCLALGSPLHAGPPQAGGALLHAACMSVHPS